MPKKSKKTAARTAKPLPRKGALAREDVNFTELHRVLDKWSEKLDGVYVRTKAPKVLKIQSAIDKLQGLINCQSTMVIGF